jgi:hypothetical protein
MKMHRRTVGPRCKDIDVKEAERKRGAGEARNLSLSLCLFYPKAVEGSHGKAIEKPIADDSMPR